MEKDITEDELKEVKIEYLSILEETYDNIDSIVENEVARDLLYQYTNYNEQISLSVLPIYYLEPNIRITVEDE